MKTRTTVTAWDLLNHQGHEIIIDTVTYAAFTEEIYQDGWGLLVTVWENATAIIFVTPEMTLQVEVFE